MLIFSRKVGQRIHIGGGIEVAVLSVRNGRVRLGLAAPRATTIRRREIDLPGPADEQDASEWVEPGDP
jgi:carbon storage regulator CsrA